MSEALKHSPDFYAGGYLVEVVGCGRDMTLKFRTSKLSALEKWQAAIQKVAVFVYNSARDDYACVTLADFLSVYGRQLVRVGVQEFSVDGNTYVPIPFDDLKELPQLGD